jgi:preprotein translocase subunit YajC
MIEFISSKVVGAIAAMVLLGSILGFFAIQRSSAEEQQFRNMCESLARTIDDVSSLNAGTAINVTFGQNDTGLRLDFSFRNQGYDIDIRAGQVIFRQGGLTAVCALTRPVHPWDPKAAGNGTTLYVSKEALMRLDAEHPVLKAPSGKDLVVESRLLAISGEMRYATFVHF